MRSPSDRTTTAMKNLSSHQPLQPSGVFWKCKRRDHDVRRAVQKEKMIEILSFVDAHAVGTSERFKRHPALR